MPPHGCRRCCRRVVIWFPMVFITLVTCWSYYAYVLELCIFTINSNTEKAIYLAFFHLFLIMWTWCYWKTIVASHDQPSNKLCLSEEDRQLYELERRPEYKQRILRRAAKHLYTTAEEIRYCERCRMFKPNQCYHCPVCDVCVLKRDHHCPWVNNCVGFSNYKFFLLFLLYSSIYCLFISGTVLQYFMRFWTDKLPDTPAKFHILILFFVSAVISITMLVLFCWNVEHNRSSIDRDGCCVTLNKNFREVFGVEKKYWLLPIFTRLDILVLIVMIFSRSAESAEIDPHTTKDRENRKHGNNVQTQGVSLTL